jgi:hypothetical protein
MVKQVAFVACNGGCRNASCGYGCIGCGMCFYNCPEPYAIKVVKP